MNQFEALFFISPLNLQWKKCLLGKPNTGVFDSALEISNENTFSVNFNPGFWNQPSTKKAYTDQDSKKNFVLN